MSIGIPKYPAAIDTPSDLVEVADNAITQLAATLTVAATVAAVISTVGFPVTGILTIGDEKIAYTGTTPDTVTGLTRGFGGTANAEHDAGVDVEILIVEEWHRAHSAAIIAIEERLTAGDVEPKQFYAGPAGPPAAGPAFRPLVVGDVAATGTPDATTYLRGDGSWSVPEGGGGGGGTPGGDDGQFQFNNAGAFAGSPALRQTPTRTVIVGGLEDNPDASGGALTVTDADVVAGTYVSAGGFFMQGGNAIGAAADFPSGVYGGDSVFLAGRVDDNGTSVDGAQIYLSGARNLSSGFQAGDLELVAGRVAAVGGGSPVIRGGSVRIASQAGAGVGGVNGRILLEGPVVTTQSIVAADVVRVPDDVYDATSWDGNLSVPTKNAVRDRIEALIGSLATAAAAYKQRIPTIVNLVSAASVAVDASLDGPFRLTLAEDVLLMTPTGMFDGQVLFFEFSQPSTGGPFILTLDTGFQLSADIPDVVLSVDADKTDLMTCVYHAPTNRVRVVALTRGF